MSGGGMLAGLPGCRAMGSAARPWWTNASSRAVTPRCTLRTCSPLGVRKAHLLTCNRMADNPPLFRSGVQCSHGVCWAHLSWSALTGA